MTWQLIKDSLLGKEQDFTSLPLKTAVFILAIPMILEMMMESSTAAEEDGDGNNNKGKKKMFGMF